MSLDTQSMPWPQLLEQQDLVISRRGARLGGLSEDAWQWQLDTGRWQLLLRGVAVAHSGPPTQRQLAWAATLSAGEGAVLTADGALRELGFDVDPSRFDVLVPAHREVRDKRFLGSTLPDITRLTVHAHSFPDIQLDGRSGLPLVPVELAALQAAEWAPTDRAAEWRIAAVVQQRLTTAALLRKTLSGAGAASRGDLIRTVLDDVELGAHARSELDFLEFLRASRLPLPDRLQRPVRRNGLRYLDAWWERQRVTAEVDGGHHRLVSTWDEDTLRSNDVVLAERHDRVLLLRLTTGNLRHDRPALARQFATALL